jgi:hypothetical protein
LRWHSPPPKRPASMPTVSSTTRCAGRTGITKQVEAGGPTNECTAGLPAWPGATGPPSWHCGGVPLGLIGDPFAEISYARARLAAAAHRPNGSALTGPCHGLTGVVELHLAGTEAWPSAALEHLRAARIVARHITRAGSSGRPGWTCGVTGGRTPNVLVGLAGVAITLVRCHAAAIVPTLAHPGLPVAAAHSVNQS